MAASQALLVNGWANILPQPLQIFDRPWSRDIRLCYQSRSIKVLVCGLDHRCWLTSLHMGELMQRRNCYQTVFMLWSFPIWTWTFRLCLPFQFWFDCRLQCGLGMVFLLFFWVIDLQSCTEWHLNHLSWFIINLWREFVVRCFSAVNGLLNILDILFFHLQKVLLSQMKLFAVLLLLCNGLLGLLSCALWYFDVLLEGLYVLRWWAPRHRLLRPSLHILHLLLQGAPMVFSCLVCHSLIELLVHYPRCVIVIALSMIFFYRDSLLFNFALFLMSWFYQSVFNFASSWVGASTWGHRSALVVDDGLGLHAALLFMDGSFFELLLLLVVHLAVLEQSVFYFEAFLISSCLPFGLFWFLILRWFGLWLAYFITIVVCPPEWVVPFHERNTQICFWGTHPHQPFGTWLELRLCTETFFSSWIHHMLCEWARPICSYRAIPSTICCAWVLHLAHLDNLVLLLLLLHSLSFSLHFLFGFVHLAQGEQPISYV